MSRPLITGAAGMLGRKLAERLDAPVLADLPDSDIAEPGVADRLVAGRPDVVFHLAAVVSGEAESDPDKGYRVNVDGTRRLLDAIRAKGHRPRFVFASSIAVFGPPFPDSIGDDLAPAPLTSYGMQKAICELLVSDATRRGDVDGVSLRLPTICVRPGEPNRAASGFFSSIIREPLRGREAVLPVPDDVRHWFASPRAAVGFLLHAAELPADALGERRCLTMPGVSATVADELAALRAVGGDQVVRLVRREPDEAVTRIVAGWPRRFDARRALELGFRAESSFVEIVRIHVEDEPAA
jgi:nucleoside-diphosphate-sugar epimerase